MLPSSPPLPLIFGPRVLVLFHVSFALASIVLRRVRVDVFAEGLGFRTWNTYTTRPETRSLLTFSLFFFFCLFVCLSASPLCRFSLLNVFTELLELLAIAAKSFDCSIIRRRGIFVSDFLKVTINSVFFTPLSVAPLLNLFFSFTNIELFDVEGFI